MPGADQYPLHSSARQPHIERLVPDDVRSGKIDLMLRDRPLNHPHLRLPASARDDLRMMRTVVNPIEMRPDFGEKLF
ncbi:MAG: hypothetical protein MPW15_03395 [Candidatus Manganitrophus sp.]|nr:hypothetical protein [Candidatus Manganitrophus sp.]